MNLPSEEQGDQRLLQLIREADARRPALTAAKFTPPALTFEIAGHPLAVTGVKKKWGVWIPTGRVGEVEMNFFEPRIAAMALRWREWIDAGMPEMSEDPVFDNEAQWP